MIHTKKRDFLENVSLISPTYLDLVQLLINKQEHDPKILE